MRRETYRKPYKGCYAYGAGVAFLGAIFIFITRIIIDKPLFDGLFLLGFILAAIGIVMYLMDQTLRGEL